jgi:uncharacterized membrane protein
MERYLLLAVVWFVVAQLISCAISVVVLVEMPYDYFRTSGTQGALHAGENLVGRARRVLKNVLGSMLVLVGAILSIPIIPGPGFLIAAAGLLLLDFPGKRRMLRKLLNKPAALRSINRLRRAFARAPLLVD